MRTAIIIADGKVVCGPGSAGELREQFKKIVEDPKSKADVIEFWTSDSGCVKRQSKAKAAVHSELLKKLNADGKKPKAEKKAPEKEKASDSEKVSEGDSEGK